MSALEMYLSQPQNPAPGSPVAEVMWRLLERFPEATMEELHRQALKLLADASGRRIYAVYYPKYEQSAAA
jgi:hypothetical protein